MKQFIKDLELGGEVDSQFSVKYKHPIREYKNGFMFVIGLADMSGEIEAIYWGRKEREKVERVYKSFGENEVVRVKGVVGEFKNRLKIDVREETGRIEKSEEYEIEDFIPKSPRDVEEMSKELFEVIEEVEEKYLKEILNSFFRDEKFLEEFKKAPAAMYIHHATLGGLLEHTLNVIKLCKVIFQIYPQLNKDLLLTGAILHDIGKVREFKVTTNIKISEEGMLRGHIILGEEIVLEKIKEKKDFPENLKIKLAHILLSHHGNNEYGSPKEPQFPEASAIYYADEFDSKVSQYVKIKEEANTEDFRIYSKRLGEIYLR